MSSSANDPHVLAVEELFRTLSTQPSVGHLAAIAHENARLRAENDTLLNENNATSTMIQRLRNNLGLTQSQFKEEGDRLQGVAKDKELLAAKLVGMQDKLKESEEKAVSLNTTLNKEREKAERKLKEVQVELQHLRQFFTDLDPVEQDEDM
jgi:chromosome segregation ATPase